jgi:hypothetical protein
MTFNQLATVLTSIVSQATGKTGLTATDTASFVSVGKLGLETGYDALSTAISQVLSKTIFSIRPYRAKFGSIEKDPIRWGNHVRKINFADTGFEEDDRIKLVDGQAIDQQIVKKPAAVQTNFYGENIYQKHITIYRDQLDVAFSGPEEFARFITGVMQTVDDELEQARENTARGTVANLIGGHYLMDGSNITNGTCVCHLLAEYNDWSGESLTAATVYNPDNFPAFARWLYGKINTLSRMMQERSANYHLATFTGLQTIMRHTPVENQRLFLMAQPMDQIGSNVLSTTFNDEYLRMLPREDVTFWQSINDPMSINLTAGYVTAAGAAASGAASLSKIVMGVLMDEEAAGYTMVNEWASPAPFNARGGYTNMFWHRTVRYYNDFSENAVVLLLD